jgi:hypothetical protein
MKTAKIVLILSLLIFIALLIVFLTREPVTMPGEKKASVIEQYKEEYNKGQQDNKSTS